MGLWKRVAPILARQGEDDFVLSEPEAFAGVAVSALAREGGLPPIDRADLIDALGDLRLFRGFSERSLKEIVDRLALRTAEEGRDALLSEAAERVPASLRGDAFALAAHLLALQGLTAPVSDALTRARIALQLREERAKGLAGHQGLAWDWMGG